MEADLLPSEIHQKGASKVLVNNGHTLQVNVEPGSWLSAEGMKYELAQFHFHSPSEHRIAGELFPLEAQFVHENEAGERAALSVLFREGAANKSLGTIEAAAPSEQVGSVPLDLALDTLGIVPEALAYNRYNGSITTPPCTEGVRWYVLQSTRTLSAEQVSTFVGLIGEDARGPQPLNARLVLR